MDFIFRMSSDTNNLPIMKETTPVILEINTVSFARLDRMKRRRGDGVRKRRVNAAALPMGEATTNADAEPADS